MKAENPKGPRESQDRKIRIMVADDEEAITDSIAYALRREGYEVQTAYDGEEAIEKIKSFKPHVIILDVMMPKYNGYDVCRRIDPDSTVGILMLTAKSQVVDKLLGLELGADDYVTKPFDLSELLARTRSLVRRIRKTSKENCGQESKRAENSKDARDGVMISVSQRTVKVDGCKVEFKPKEFDLLAFLVKNSPRAMTREMILQSVWEMEYAGGTRTVDIHIQRIRKKLKGYGACISTVPKIGYRIEKFEGDMS